MTYYSLYFPEEPFINERPLMADDETGSDASDSETRRAAIGKELHRPNIERDELSSSTLKTIVCDRSDTSAALIGVRAACGTSSSVGSAINGQQKGSRLATGPTNANYRKSTESHLTLHFDQIPTDPSQITYALSKQSDSETGEAGDQRHYTSKETDNRDDNVELKRRPASDNTSLSSSVMAELEEDDILQYSGPIDPVLANEIGLSCKSRPSYTEANAQDEREVDGAQTNHLFNDTTPSGNNYKSSSSGYDSNCSMAAQTSTSNGPLQRPQSPDLVQRAPVPTMSSTTADSMALVSSVINSVSCLAPSGRSVMPQQVPVRPAVLSKRKLFGLNRQNSETDGSQSKTRYWQLCMFIIGGKQSGVGANGDGLSEPISIWRLYI